MAMRNLDMCMRGMMRKTAKKKGIELTGTLKPCVHCVSGQSTTEEYQQS